MSPRIRWILIPVVALAVAAPIFLLFSYEVIAVDFPVLMEDQPVVEYHDGPHLVPPEEAVPISRPVYKDAGQPENPVPADVVSVERGEILFSLHCSACHGLTAQGDGPVTKFWKEDNRMPPDLSEARISSLPDSAIYEFISNGIGTMPPLRENLSERQRWDVINYLRTLE